MAAPKGNQFAKGSGRVSDAVRHRFERILKESNAHERMRRILSQTKKDDVFIKAYELCTNRAYGKPSQAIDLNETDTGYSRLSATALREIIDFIDRRDKGGDKEGA